jgi:predicted ArsR family transcriptional regulator
MASSVASTARRRDQILAELAAAGSGMGAADIAATVGVHLTTARFHLDRLEQAGLVRRELTRSGRRGRPSVSYRLVPSGDAATPNRALVAVLAAVLAEDPDGGRARAEHAGAVWAESLTVTAERAGAAPHALLESRMEQLGFAPRAAEECIELRACPFREAARAHPDVVCSVHRGLIARILEDAGRGPDEAELVPFVEPELCTITLSDHRS